LCLCILVIVAAAGSKSASCQGFFDYVPNQPYTAQVVVTHLEDSGNGTPVRREARQIQMRDSQGRTRIAPFTPNPQPCGHVDGRPGSDPQGIVNLFVPLRRQFIQLFTWNKTARIMSFPGTGPIPTHGPNPNVIQTTTENLPGQTLHGIYAVGIRTTEMLPHDNGDAANIVTTLETWSARDLGIMVLFKYTSTDTRTTGESSNEIEKLDRCEPDAALFEIPADYKIEKVSLDPQADPPAVSATSQQPAKQPCEPVTRVR